MYVFFSSITLFIYVSEINQNDRFIGTTIYNVLRENQPLKLLNEKENDNGSKTGR